MIASQAKTLHAGVSTARDKSLIATCHSSLSRILLGSRVLASVPQRYQLAAIGQRDRIIKFGVPVLGHHDRRRNAMLRDVAMKPLASTRKMRNC
jgi:hypothetical protein